MKADFEPVVYGELSILPTDVFTFLLLLFYCVLCSLFYGLTPEIKMD